MGTIVNNVTDITKKLVLHFRLPKYWMELKILTQYVKKMKWNHSIAVKVKITTGFNLFVIHSVSGPFLKGGGGGGGGYGDPDIKWWRGRCLRRGQPYPLPPFLYATAPKPERSTLKWSSNWLFLLCKGYIGAKMKTYMCHSIGVNSKVTASGITRYSQERAKLLKPINMREKPIFHPAKCCTKRWWKGKICNVLKCRL